MLTEIKGKFISHDITEKQGTNGPFKVGSMLVEIDASYENKGQRVQKLTVIPFKVFGKSADVALNARAGQELDISYELSSWQNKEKTKTYPEIKAVFVKLGKAPEGKATDDISF